MRVTREFSLGDIMTIVMLVGIAIGVGLRVGNIESASAMHTKIIDRLASRMDAYDAQLRDLREQIAFGK